VVDTPSVKTTESGGPSGYDAGKKIKGRKRHIVTDAFGHLVGLQVHAADIQDRDGAVPLFRSIQALYPWLRHIFADGAYAGDKLEKRSDTAKGFEVLPRPAAKDFEATITSAVAWVLIAHIRRLTRRIARA
jgi:Transposase DDE domain